MKQYETGVIEPVYPVVGLDEFFDGNSDDYSIAPNDVGYGHPGLATFHAVLSEIRRKPEVQDVLIAILECPDADEPADAKMWPAAGFVYILTSAGEAEVEGWTASLKPAGVGEGWSGDIKPPAAPKLQNGNQVFGVAWD